jgi:hypothetical protein
MFGWFKKRLLARMDNLTKVAQMATCVAITRELKNREANEESVVGMKGAARANFLFGHKGSELHRQQLDLPSEERAALEWLRDNAVFCELVVQSLRVMNMVGFGRHGTVGAVVGEPMAGKDLVTGFCVVRCDKSLSCRYEP